MGTGPDDKHVFFDRTGVADPEQLRPFGANAGMSVDAVSGPSLPETLPFGNAPTFAVRLPLSRARKATFSL